MFYSDVVNVNRIHRRKELTVKCKWMFSMWSAKRYKGLHNDYYCWLFTQSTYFGIIILLDY